MIIIRVGMYSGRAKYLGGKESRRHAGKKEGKVQCHSDKPMTAAYRNDIVKRSVHSYESDSGDGKEPSFENAGGDGYKTHYRSD